MTKVILVRHGETDWNKVHRLQGGASDTSLNDTGQHQAGQLASRLASEKILAVYSSPLQRAAYTAQLIAASHGLDVKIVQELKEICLGNLEGFPGTQLPESFENYIAQNKHLSQNEDRGAESIENVQKRAWQAVKTIITEYPGGTLVVVSHYFVIDCLVCRVLDLPLDRIGRLRLNPGTLTTFALGTDGSARLDLFNGPA